MTFKTLTLAVAATLVLSGAALAQDAMSTPMQGDAMAPMDADAMLAECLEKAGMMADAMGKDNATKACHDEHDAMAG